MSKMEELLMEAFIGESIARNRYKFFAEEARREGLYYFAKVFEELAQNEESHARELYFSMKKPDITRRNLEEAIIKERTESESIYPKMAESAMREGKMELARIFKQIGKIENQHMEKLMELLLLLDKGMIYKRDTPIKWKCSICGYVHTGKEPPKKCPGCRNNFKYYEPEDLII